ncbi:RNA-binding KH domain-containing protein RCF3-like isoform X2 [Corylus avellana]|uniref:RNA-binding KH domain-containing protein RCF3-like isoform X2 n=1 Tax=Corylus avellana TaxID=13451 RepID=UPI002869EDAB|nr:RNA-binding KH domain-containing protein RCF3-like isoform X2 [Corylus avellana]
MEDSSNCSSLSDQRHDAVSSTQQQRKDSHKRDHPKRPATKLSPGQAAFRFLIHVSSTRRLLGNNGAGVSRIRRETGSRIHCEAAAPGSDHRIVLIVGSGLRAERKLSNAQEAMLRVFERVWESAVAENEIEVWWKMVAHRSQIGPVVGKGGKNIKRVRSESGAQVRIFPAPDWTVNDYEFIQITGVASAVKKALIDVSNCLQDCPPLDKCLTWLTRTLEGSSEGSSHVASPDPHAELSPPFSSPGNSGISALNGNRSIRADNGGDSSQDKKGRQQEEVVFRMLCTNHAASWVIGKKGAIVRALENESGASIMFAASLTESRERVATVSAREDLESACSPAQNAVVLLFARIIGGVAERGGLSEGRRVMAKLLVASDLVGCLGSNDDEILSEMREVTGADIWALEREQTLNCASVNDVVVQITGEYKSVQHALFQVTGCLRDGQVRAKKPHVRVTEDPLRNDLVPHNIGGLSSALRLQQITDGPLASKKEQDVSTYLQDCLSVGKAPTPFTRPLGSSSYGASPDPHAELFSHLSSPLLPLPGNSGNSSSNANTLSSLIHANGVVSGQDKKGTRQEVVFRMLCSGHAAGSVIGKKGTIVRALQNEAGASISFSSPLTESHERVVTISAWENLESAYSPAQNAVVLVFRRIIEGVIGRGHLSGLSEGRPVTAKLLVSSDLVGCLSGNDGKELSGMREVTGADILILEEDQILDCASVNDVVVQISGEYKSVQEALFLVTGSLRDKFLPSEVFKEARAKSHCVRVNEDPLRNNPVPHNIGSSPPRFQTGRRGQTTAISDHERGLTTFGGDYELGSGNKLATVTNTTVEIRISEHVFGSVYGEDGTNLESIIQVQKSQCMILVLVKEKGGSLFQGHLIKPLQLRACFKPSSNLQGKHHIISLISFNHQVID